MSTYWNIECRRCGLEVFEDSYGWTSHHGEEFAKLCASSLLSTVPENTGAWELVVINHFDRSINMACLRTTECAHDFEPRNEYGEWATPDMWPDGHPKSQVTEGSKPPDCSGLGEARCIGE